MDKEFRKQAIIQLARQEYNYKIKTILNQEIDQISIILLENDEYYTLVESLSLLDYIAFRETAKSLKIIDEFLERLRAFFTGKEAGFKIYELEELATKGLAIVNHIRYHDVEAVLNLLKKHFNSFGNKKVQDKIIAIIGNLSEYNIDVLSKVGLSIQDQIIENLNTFRAEEKIEYSSIIAEICKNLLSCETRADSSTYDTFTFRRGSIRATDIARKIRASAISLLESTYNLVQRSSVKNKIEKAAEIIESLNRACWQDSQSEKNDDDYYDLFNLVLENSKEVAKFYASKIADREHKLTQVMENSLARLHYRSSEINSEKTPSPKIVKTNDELKILIEHFRDTAWQDEEYVIYRDLTSGYHGFRSIDKSYWGEKYQNEQKVIDEYAELVNEQNLEKWSSRIFNIIKIEGNKDLFFIGNFLATLARKSPDLAIKILKNKSKEVENLSLSGHFNIVISSILIGLFDGRKEDAKNLVMECMAKDLYLKECIAALPGIKGGLDFSLLERLFDKAKESIEAKKEDSDILCRFILVMNNIRSAETHREAKEFVLKIIKELIKNQNNGWIIYAYSPNSLVGEIIENLTNPEDVKIILDAMISLERIDYDDEEVLARLVKKYPEEVIGFFEKRLSKERSRDARYDAIPYEFYNKTLKQEIAKSFDKLLEIAKSSFSSDPSLFVFKWGKLLQIIFDDLPENFIDRLAQLGSSSDENDIKFVLKVLRGITTLRDCHNIEKLKIVCKAVVQNTLYQEEKFYPELSIAITSTGVVTGKYGFAEAREKRVTEMKDWENDSNEKVREFYKKFSESELEYAQQERKRADEQEELRKYEFENS